MNKIIAFVGPSGAGKTTLMESLVNRYPHRFGFLPGFITRPLRPGEEHFNLTVIPLEEGRDRYQRFLAGARQDSANVAEIAGHYYGNEKETTDALLRERTGLKDLVVDGVLNFLNAGYHVDVIRVNPIGHRPRPGREEADAYEAARYGELNPILMVTTDHRDPHGKAKALNHVLKRIV